MWTTITIILLVILFILWKMFIVVEMRHEVIKERLGKYSETLKPGFHFLIPFLDRAAYQQEMREQVLDVPSQKCITSDNIMVEVDGILYLKVMDAYKASYGIEHYRGACVNLAQTTMRSEIGKMSLDNTFSERDIINENIVREIDKASEPWGVKVMRYEIKDITPSGQVIETMERQMEAERDKRAAIIRSSGEKDYKINISEGEKLKAINISEGEKARRIAVAEGLSREITLIAEASSNGIKMISEAISQPGGSVAVRMQLIEQYVRELSRILRDADVTVVPAELANIKGFFEGLNRVGTGFSNAGADNAAAEK